MCEGNISVEDSSWRFHSRLHDVAVFVAYLRDETLTIIYFLLVCQIIPHFRFTFFSLSLFYRGSMKIALNNIEKLKATSLII